MKQIILAGFMMGSAVLAKAQKSEEKPRRVEIVINHEMIERFNSVQSEGEIFSWSQLMMSCNSKSMADLMALYRSSNLEEESMQDIWLALQEKTDNTEEDEYASDEYYASLNQIKQEISAKLANGVPIAMK